MAKKKLSPQRRLFCFEYMIDKNMTQAAIRAKYSKKTAYSKGSQLLKIVEIKEFIDKLTGEQEERTLVKSDDVIKELAKIAFSNIEDFLTIDKDGDVIFTDFATIEREKLSVIESIKVTKSTTEKDTEHTTTQFKLHNKLSALNDLCKHKGLFAKDNVHTLNIQLLPPQINRDAGHTTKN